MQEALARMANRGFLGSRRYAEQQWRARRTGAHPDILEFESALVRRWEKLGVPMFTHECVRSAERQDELFRDGFSKARAGSSAHEFGCAVDVVHGVLGWNLDARQWGLVAHVGKEVAAQKGIAVVWGGDWKFYDPAHWELETWKQIKGGFPWPTK